MIPVPEVSPITAGSVLQLAGALGWLGLVLCAIAGYGGAVLRGCGVKRPEWALAAVVGFVPAILIGGVLNLLQMIRPGGLIGFVVLGALPAAYCTWMERGRGQRSWTAGRGGLEWMVLAAALLVAGVRVAATVHPSNYEPSDDLNFYFAAPVKMIEMHSFAPDPYSERRITSSVGGNQFLCTLILATQPLESLPMADAGLGALLLLALAFSVGDEFELSALQRNGFALLLMIMPQIRLNSSFVVVPSALFLGMVYVAAHRRLSRDHPLLQACLLGGMVGAVATMKSTYVTHGVIFVVCLALLYGWKRGFAGAMRLVLPAAALCFLTMLPWMVASGQTSGTWFYPLLGKGVHFSAYGHYRMPNELTVAVIRRKILPFCLPLLALFGLELFLCEDNERDYSIPVLMLTSFVASALVGMATGGDSLKRYNFSCLLPAVCLIFVLCARRSNLEGGTNRWRWMQVGAAAMITVLAVSIGMSTFTNEYLFTLHAFQLAPHAYRLTNEALHQEYATVERAIPADGDVLATTTVPFLFDFRERPILLADYPGDASPKPGWPAKQSGEALAQFLLAHHVRYLVYGYGECDSTKPHATCEAMFAADDERVIHSPATTALIRGETESGYDARKQYGELARTKRHLYDDGRIYVLDLAS